MNLEDTTVTIESRSLGACLDLAFVFYRHHARPLLVLTLLFAVPAALLSSFLVSVSGAAGLLWLALVFFLSGPLLGAVVVSGAGRAVFGESLEPMSALRGLNGVWWPLLFALLTSRLLVLLVALPCLGLSGLFADAYYGFTAEVIVLERLRGARARRRNSDLVRPTYFDLVWRDLALLLFTITATLALFILTEQAFALLLGRSFVLGRLDSRFFGESLQLLLADPWVMGLLSGTLWFVYPVARLAWFFSYLDVRIRKEGWDLELGFRMEARRVGASA